MAFRIGLIGLCTSHPGTWTPIIRKMSEEKIIDAEITVAWDSGETRPAGYTEEFCALQKIPKALSHIEEAINLVDGVIVHTANWDHHLEQAEPFLKAGKSVYIDKPIVGNIRDANRFLDWMKQGYRITGGSVMRYCRETSDLLALPVEERGDVRTAYTSIGVDDFNYGIHGYALLSSVFGKGIRSVRYLGKSNQKQVMLEWNDGKTGLLTVGRSEWLPFHVTVTTEKKVFQLPIAVDLIYRSMLDKVMPYFTRMTDIPPLGMDELLEPELAALAAKQSWQNNGAAVFLDDLGLDSAGYDGSQFAREYYRTRMK